MSILRSPSVPFYANPLFRPALDALAGYLERRNYSQHARERIVRHTAVEGTPTGCPYLDHPVDEAGATEAFVGALPPVALGSEAWDPEGAYVARPAPAGWPSHRRGIARDPWPYLLSRLLGQVLLGIGGLILSVGVAVNQAWGGGGPGAVLVAGGALAVLVAGAGLLLLVDVARSLRRLSRGGAGGAGVE